MLRPASLATCLPRNPHLPRFLKRSACGLVLASCLAATVGLQLSPAPARAASADLVNAANALIKMQSLIRWSARHQGLLGTSAVPLPDNSGFMGSWAGDTAGSWSWHIQILDRAGKILERVYPARNDGMSPKLQIPNPATGGADFLIRHHDSDSPAREILTVDRKGQEVSRVSFTLPALMDLSWFQRLPQGGWIVTGRHRNGPRPPGHTRPWAAILDAEGRIARDLSHLFMQNGGLFDLETGPDGSILLGVTIGNDQVRAIDLIRLTAGGDLIWRRKIEQHDTMLDGNGLLFLEDGGFLLSLDVSNPLATAAKQVDLLRLDDQGNVLWSNNVYRNVGGVTGFEPILVDGNPAFLFRGFVDREGGLAMFGLHSGNKIGEELQDDGFFPDMIRSWPAWGGNTILTGEVSDKTDSFTRGSRIYDITPVGQVLSREP